MNGKLLSVRLGNFKSYQRAEISLSALTFLIGANASGKSNALEGIRLLSWLAKGSRLDDIERTIQSGDPVVRGQATDLFYEPGQSFTLGGIIVNFVFFEIINFEIQIGQLSDQLIVTAETVKLTSENLPLYKIDGNPNPHTDEISVMYNNFQKGKYKPHIPCSNRQAIFYQLGTPSRFDKMHIKSQKIIPEVTKNIRENLRNIVFLDPRPAVMRDYTYAKDDDMKEDGANLSSVLYRICQQGEEGKVKLLNFIRSLPEQDIIDIQFIKTERNDVMVRLVESFGNHQRNMDAPLLSDGTLRVLAIGATLLSVPVDPKQGDSRIVRLADLERFPELVAQGTLGQLMTNKILERFLKDDSTAEERQQKALAWLEQLPMEEVTQ